MFPLVRTAYVAMAGEVQHRGIHAAAEAGVSAVAAESPPMYLRRRLRWRPAGVVPSADTLGGARVWRALPDALRHLPRRWYVE
jgi:hypothetical protein